MTNTINEKLKKFDTAEHRNQMRTTWARYDQFIETFPFREHPEIIDRLTRLDLYNPRSEEKNYFFTWIEHKLKGLGHLRVASSKFYENAASDIETFKQLLKIVVNDSLTISQKIDSHWDDIKGFGGDRNIAKKILFVYYPKDTICSYKTSDMESLAESVGINYKAESYSIFKKDYDLLSVGQKFELFNRLFLRFKESYPELAKMDNCYFMWFLYESFPVSRDTDNDEENEIEEYNPRIISLGEDSDYALPVKPVEIKDNSEDEKPVEKPIENKQETAKSDGSDMSQDMKTFLSMSGIIIGLIVLVIIIFALSN